MNNLLVCLVKFILAFIFAELITWMLFIIKNENLMADEKSCNSMLYIEESRLV